MLFFWKVMSRFGLREEVGFQYFSCCIPICPLLFTPNKHKSVHRNNYNWFICRMIVRFPFVLSTWKSYKFYLPDCRPKSRDRIKIMYVYHIFMKIYVFVYTNIHSPSYFLSATIILQHYFYYGFHTFINYANIFKD